MKQKFEGMELKDLSKLVSCTTILEKSFKEEYERKNFSKGTYDRRPNIEIHLVEFKDQTDDELIEVVATKP